MIINSRNEVAMGNTEAGTAFKISASSKAFKILSSSIYKNKVRAIVRELVCNAVDAHVMNSSTKKFVVSAPNALDLRFIVRDFGPGINHEDIMEMYTTYFMSTKDQRNDQIGALGLGSKSPFSYTDTFSVISRHEGMARAYQCMLSGGEPSIVLVHEEETDEPSGLEVIVPVKAGDISKWHGEICYVMRPFKSDSYEVEGITTEITPFDKRPNYSDDWFVLKTTGTPKIYAIYGSIVYPLTGVDGLNTAWLSNLGGNVYIHFEPSSIDFQPSREELSLDEDTVKSIITRVNKLTQADMTQVIDKISSIKSLREKIREIHKISYGQQCLIDATGTTFDGKTIADLLKTDDWYSLVQSVSQSGAIVSYGLGKIVWRNPVPRGNSRRAKDVWLQHVYGPKKERAFVLIHDAKGHSRRYLLGLFNSDEPGHPTVDDKVFVGADYAGFNRTVEQIKEVMDTDEVIVLRTSELQHLIVKAPPRARAYQARPPSPNGQKFELINGSWKITDLYMTATEARDLTGPIVGMYRDEVCAAGYGFQLVPNTALSTISKLARVSGITEYTMVRPSVFKYVTNPQCVFNMFAKRFKELDDKVPVGELMYLDDSRVCIKIKQNKHLKFLANELTSTMNVYSSEFSTFGNVFINMRFYSNELSELVDDTISSYRAKLEYAKKTFSAAYDKFKSENSAIEYYLRDRYTIDDNEAKSIAKQFLAMNPQPK